MGSDAGAEDKESRFEAGAVPVLPAIDWSGEVALVLPAMDWGE